MLLITAIVGGSCKLSGAFGWYDMDEYMGIWQNKKIS